MSLSNTFTGVVNVLTARYGGNRQRAIAELQMKRAIVARGRREREEAFKRSEARRLQLAMESRRADGYQTTNE